jgi:IS5 family transposase
VPAGVGCEGRISVINRRHGLQRCLYHGSDGLHRWVGLAVIADNLLTIARTTGRRQPAVA